MKKFYVFDLDGTLAPIGRRASEECVKMLRELENEQRAVCICSGKPTFYLCGFARQLGLRKPILIGENGASFQYGVDLPPEISFTLPFPKEKLAALRMLKDRIDKAFDKPIWFQPNGVVLTPFVNEKEDFDVIDGVLENSRDLLDGIVVYKQCDCYDILPEEVSKKEALRYLANKEGAGPSQFIAVGDGINDLPMFCYVGLSVGIGEQTTGKATLHFDCIEDALRHLLDMVREGRL